MRIAVSYIALFYTLTSLLAVWLYKRLGARADRYIRASHGEMMDDLNTNVNCRYDVETPKAQIVIHVLEPELISSQKSP